MVDFLLSIVGLAALAGSIFEFYKFTQPAGAWMCLEPVASHGSSVARTNCGCSTRPWSSRWQVARR